MKITLNCENEMGEDRELVISNEGFNQTNWISLICKEVVLEIPINELISALKAFEDYDIRMNKPE